MRNWKADSFLGEGIQGDTASIPRETDVLIVGAGPAGSTAAIHLAGKGHRTLLLDREPFPREKVCGDGLLVDSLGPLGRAGVLHEVLAHAQSSSEALCYSPRWTEVRVKMDLYGIRRSVLDALLAAQAVKAGARFCRGRATGLDKTGEGETACRVEGLPHRVRTRVVLLATGAELALARGAGLVHHGRSTGVGVRCYLRSKIELCHPVFSYEREMGPGYGWMFPLGDGWYNLGCGVAFREDLGPRRNLRAAFAAFLRHAPAVRRVVDAGAEPSPLKGAMMRCGLQGISPYDGDSVLALGDTIGAALPFSGEGVSKAQRTGEIAARAVDEALSKDDPGRLGLYPELLETELRRQCDAYKLLEDLVAKAWLSELGAHVANRSATVRDVMSRIVAEELDPLFVWNAKNVARVLWGRLRSRLS